MSYENAPATQMLATDCFHCGRPLLDAKSVEIGIGPVCRRNMGYNDSQKNIAEQDRVRVNQWIHRCGCSNDPAIITQAVEVMEIFGFNGVAEAVIRAKCRVRIAVDTTEARYLVATPYNPSHLGAIRAIPGRQWDKDRKVNTFPLTSVKELFAFLRRYYAGTLAHGTKGLFVVPGAVKEDAQAAEAPKEPKTIHGDKAKIKLAKLLDLMIKVNGEADVDEAIAVLSEDYRIFGGGERGWLHLFWELVTENAYCQTTKGGTGRFATPTPEDPEVLSEGLSAMAAEDEGPAAEDMAERQALSGAYAQASFGW